MFFDKNVLLAFASILSIAAAIHIFHHSEGPMLAAAPLFLFSLLGPWATSDTANVAHLSQALAPDGYPPSAAWDSAEPVAFNSDWQGKHSDPEMETEVRLLWTAETLYLHFRSRYRTLTVFSDAGPNGRRDHLWDRDVVEVFLQPDPTYPGHYFEFEVSPNGYWIDLDIEHGERSDLNSGMKCRTHIDEKSKVWTAELAIPLRSVALHFGPSSIWRMNFFRVEGAAEPRFYSSWRPTNTPEPNFHVPTAFGKLKFLPPAEPK
ncbi:MAG TPA: carbohydrate-binding family 9-like protein [Candidatus Acidoferrum sp.]|nr:carbohydrate-binding family 9-like protein [Candidatus Acidoferrum sp.]